MAIDFRRRGKAVSHVSLSDEVTKARTQLVQSFVGAIVQSYQGIRLQDTSNGETDRSAFFEPIKLLMLGGGVLIQSSTAKSRPFKYCTSGHKRRDPVLDRWDHRPEQDDHALARPCE